MLNRFFFLAFNLFMSYVNALLLVTYCSILVANTARKGFTQRPARQSQYFHRLATVYVLAKIIKWGEKKASFTLSV